MCCGPVISTLDRMKQPSLRAAAGGYNLKPFAFFSVLAGICMVFVSWQFIDDGLELVKYEAKRNAAVLSEVGAAPTVIAYRMRFTGERREYGLLVWGPVGVAFRKGIVSYDAGQPGPVELR